MKKWKIRAVISLMVVALAGLIIIQVFWISQAISVNKQIFGRHVNDALQNVALKLERKDAFAFVSRKSQKDTSILPDVGVKTLSPGALRPYLLRDLRRLKYADYALTDVPVEFTDEHRRLPNFHLQKPKRDSVKIQLSIADTINEEELELLEIEKLTSLSSTEELNKVLKKKYLLQKLAVDLVQRNSPVEQRIDFDQLNHLLRDELLNQGIDIPFRYAVFEKKHNRFVFASEEEYMPQLAKTIHKAQLFPNDFFLEPNFIQVYFPGQQLYIIQKISTILATSFIFIVILVLTFLWMIRSFLEQKKLSEMKTDFINNMTHEFKTPITTIALATEAMKDNEVRKDETRLNRLAEMVQEENKRLEAQVERVLQIAKLQKGEFKLNIENVDIHTIIEKAINHVSLMLAEKNGQLQCVLNAEKTAIPADKVHLTNIIYNLLDNAIKYTQAQPEINISTYNNDHKIVVEIKDNGIGMSPDAQKRIFEQFYRVPTGNVHDVKGFGLGLSYVKTMLEAHGGNIQVHSTPGKGSTFTFTLPLN